MLFYCTIHIIRRTQIYICNKFYRLFDQQTKTFTKQCIIFCYITRNNSKVVWICHVSFVTRFSIIIYRGNSGKRVNIVAKAFTKCDNTNNILKEFIELIIKIVNILILRKCDIIFDYTLNLISAIFTMEISTISKRSSLLILTVWYPYEQYVGHFLFKFVS